MRHRILTMVWWNLGSEDEVEGHSTEIECEICSCFKLLRVFKEIPHFKMNFR